MNVDMWYISDSHDVGRETLQKDFVGTLVQTVSQATPYLFIVKEAGIF